MSKPLLIDTDVLIDYLREQSEAVTYIARIDRTAFDVGNYNGGIVRWGAGR